MIDAVTERELREGFFASSAPDRGLFGRRRLEFEVVGVPRPQGSMRSFAWQVTSKITGQKVYRGDGTPLLRTATTSDNPNTKEWRQIVADAAQ